MKGITKPGRRGPRGRGIADDYGIDVPVIGAGMAFVALPRLAAAVSNAGGLGVLGASPLPPPHLARMLRQMRTLTRRPFGVNLINARGFPGSLVPFTTGIHVAICARERVPVVWFHWDLPPRRWIERLHRAGTRVWMQVGSVDEANRAIELGVDAVIAQGANAGGHSKATESLADLLPRVVAAAQVVPVLAAGGIATGEHVARAIGEGAAGRGGGHETRRVDRGLRAPGVQAPDRRLGRDGHGEDDFVRSRVAPSPAAGAAKPSRGRVGGARGPDLLPAAATPADRPHQVRRCPLPDVEVQRHVADP